MNKEIIGQEKRKFRVIEGGKVSSVEKEDSYRKFIIIIILFITQFVFCKSDLFLIREIAVLGNKYIPVEKIVEQSGVVRKNIWYIIFDIGDTGESKIISRLKSIPWISDVELQFELPDRIIINIKERVPIAMVKSGDKSFYIDEEGIIVSNVEILERWDFPLIRGLDERTNLPGNKLKINNLDLLLSCLKSYDSMMRENFPEIEIDESGNIILYSQYKIKFNIGSEKDDLENKLSLIPSILQTLKDKHLDVNFVDMRYKRFVLKLNKPVKNNNISSNLDVHKEE
ncbi:MAG: cell division protein FtsQ [bacterium ADurb.Bin363]|nr:MAG: cell division protein FtsQ [bacterium ADurb.Bin363]